LQNKKTRSDRDNIALNKHEQDLARSTHDYELADEALRSSLPKLNGATFSLLPHLLANQIILQNNLIGNLYTVLHQYSHSNGYPDPPPELEEVVPVWESSFTSLRKEIESDFELLKGGKAIHQPMRLPDQGATLTGLGIRNKVIPGRKVTSSESIPTTSAPAPRVSRLPSTHSLNVPQDHSPPPAYNLSSKPSVNSLHKPRIGASHSPMLSPGPTENPWQSRRPSTGAASYASSNTTTTTNGHDDYFARPRIGSSTSSAYGSSPNPAAGKKKPPPPPPKKIGSFQGEYVTAMYDFDAASEGDLAFREGDRIRIVKKTNSSQDWWEGELRGMRGSFPANYCK
jgi:amphiphysin